MPVMELVDVRAAAAAVLAPQTDSDPDVIANVVDSLTPPAYMLAWSEPWLEPGPPGGNQTMGPCVWTAHLMVYCISQRYEPGSGIETLEQMVSTALDRFMADTGYRWPPGQVTGPRRLDFQGLVYLGTIINYAVPTTV